MSEGAFSIMDLFREEVRVHGAALNEGLLALEHDAANPQRIEPLMRAAHSLKGAARIVGIDLAVHVAHDLEEVFVAAQNGRIRLEAADIDLFLRTTDLLAELANVGEDAVEAWSTRQAPLAAELREKLQARLKRTTSGEPGASATGVVTPAGVVTQTRATPTPVAHALQRQTPVAHAPGSPTPVDYTANPLFELYREEVATHSATMLQALRELEKDAGNQAWLDTLLHATRSIRSAARIVGVDPAARLAASLEEVVTRENPRRLGPAELPAFREGIDVLAALGQSPPATAETRSDLAQRQQVIMERLQPHTSAAQLLEPAMLKSPAFVVAAVAVEPVAPATPAPALAPPSTAPAQPAETVVRVTAQSLNRLMSLAGESLVQARWLQPFSTNLLKLKKQHDYLAELLGGLSQALTTGRGDQAQRLAGDAHRQATACLHVLAERIAEFEDHAAQAEDLNTRLYDEVIVSRMRPFSDGAQGFPRLVRDMARRLNKQVRLEIAGPTTPVDRDILEKLEAPLTHLLRNCVDHGIEPPAERLAAGKPEAGVITLEARHRAGMLAITVADDGAGIDLARLRRKIVEKGLAAADAVESMTESELLEFLFLPGFTTAAALTEYSGRGVGLDVVHETARRVGGSVRLSTRPGRGTTFHLQLPLTLSVVRAVLVDIAGEPYAFPHNRIDRLLRIPQSQVRSLENRQFATVAGHNVGLVVAAQLFDQPLPPPSTDDLSVLFLSDASGTYGLIVDAIRGEQDIVVRALDPRLGKVPNISAAAILDDGAPVLIADVEDMARSMDQFIRTGTLSRLERKSETETARKRILVVDDSITVRETERQLLRTRGYDVAVAVDGQDGWNVLQSETFDLVVTDVDMPRKNGLELVRAMRQNDRWKQVPVVIISYKDREEDRLRGLEVGANYYLTKSSFHDNTFLQAVADLIGEP